MEPSEVVIHRADNCVELNWPDGYAARLSAPLLRAWCPCAVCQGHSGTRRRGPVDGTIALVDAWEIGAYAIGLRFSDRHDTGVYSWAWLREVAQREAAAAP